MSPDLNIHAGVQSPKPEAVTRPAEAAARPAVADTGSVAETVKAVVAEARPSSVEFAPDPESGAVIVRIINPETGDLIRQIPSEDALAVARAIGKMQGFFLDQKA